ncbi:MAG TPA: TRAFs-binding domain-containing protein [Povalibacter sp.]|uniref:TRAFs-binding domain-containing protein n=1 Tax=Povalibacter sp. TaxID=1962978 RepID=UPI002CC517C8|nr:TRAFs-binding domain-containing protein [Povalibacter sp.]HMN43838.1 TRAFs-binding domain-containing protein [Povalibacter sp.]
MADTGTVPIPSSAPAGEGQGGGLSSLPDLRDAARRTLDALSTLNARASLDTARALLEPLRDAREYRALMRLAEAIGRLDPKDFRTRRLYAQALIEVDLVTAAIDVLQAFIHRLPANDCEAVEAMGLLGRAHKQIFFDARDRTDPGARHALTQAIAAYRNPFERNPANVWHGANLVALLANSRRLGIPVATDLDPVEVAQRLVKSLDAVPDSARDEWYLPSLAEAYLGLDRWDDVERTVKSFAAGPGARAFLLASALRQFTRVWDLEATERGRGLVDILRARLLQVPGGELRIDSGDLQRLHQQPAPSDAQLEAILGKRGAQTFKWWKTGLARAQSVASIRPRLGSRIGTGFLLRAGDVGIAPADELVVLTNFHVVNPNGASPGIRPEDAEVVFEAVDADTVYEIDTLLWSSAPEQCDASLLRLKQPVRGIEPLPVAKSLPVLGESAQVYVVGYPGGRDLSFSFQDNELLDHEGPPNGVPQIPGVCRVHYTAPTEGGSSGSPVFNANLWQVIALHHKGGKTGMPKLNGASGSYGANEGISIQSIAAFPKKT